MFLVIAYSFLVAVLYLWFFVFSFFQVFNPLVLQLTVREDPGLFGTGINLSHGFGSQTRKLSTRAAKNN